MRVAFIFCLACRTSHEFASKIPYMVVPGNHEAECHSPACLSSPRRLKVRQTHNTCVHTCALVQKERGRKAGMERDRPFFFFLAVSDG